MTTPRCSRYQTSVKQAVKLESQNFDGVLEVMCIRGGPITQLEAAEMERIMQEAKGDCSKSGVSVTYEISYVSYRNFLLEYEPWCISQEQELATDEAVMRHGDVADSSVEEDGAISTISAHGRTDATLPVEDIGDIEALRATCDRHSQELATKDAELAAKDAELAAKDAELLALRARVSSQGVPPTWKASKSHIASPARKLSSHRAGAEDDLPPSIEASAAPSEGQPPEKLNQSSHAATQSNSATEARASFQKVLEADAISALKVAYKDAKRRSMANPSDADLKAKYKEAKRLYTRARAPPPQHPNPEGVEDMSDQPTVVHMEPRADLALLKSAYKEAKQRSQKNPTNSQLAAAYKKQKRLYKQAAAAAATDTDTDI
eukprot:COSAG02_NODE_7508_length_2978_cov_2.591872_2_plen_377_part_00